MKSLIITLVLACTAATSHGQGTIQFANSVLTKVTMVDASGNSTFAPPNILINYGVFFGTTAELVSALPVLPLGTTHPTYPGIINIPPISDYRVAGTQGGETVFLRVRGWSAEYGTDWQTASVSHGAWFGETEIRPFKLGPTPGPGTVIWTSSFPETGRLLPLVLHQVPEPSTFALVAVGCLLVLLNRRK